VLSLISLAVSIYLSIDHISPFGSRLCDFGDTFSCSIVLHSSYSVLFGVPVAFFGVSYNVFSIFLLYHSARSDYYLFTLWQYIGLTFVVYLLWAEYMLQAICPACTIVHIANVLTVATLWLRPAPASAPSTSIPIATTLILGAILFGGPLIGMLLVPDDFCGETTAECSFVSECLADNGVRMYGTATCPACRQQKLLFDGADASFEWFVECHNNPDCMELKIKALPTWIQFDRVGRELWRREGVHSLAELRELAGCVFED